MEPVQLAGTTVRHATLHNFDQIERLDVHLGDTVVVEKAGEIIPKISRVIKAKRPAGAVPVPRPTKCPVCNGDIEQDGVSLRCIDYNCSAQVKERLIHFVARNYMDIDGCGRAIIEALVDEGLVRNCADLYELEPFQGKLMKLAGMGKKSVLKLLAGIEASKKQPLNRLLAALNIRAVGRTASEL